jgi:hypothetical protein
MLQENATTGLEKRNYTKKVGAMGNWNKNIRIGLRWTHLLIGWLIGVLVYTPAREDATFILLMQFVFVPILVITGLWMWQQARLRRLYRRLREAWQRRASNEPR